MQLILVALTALRVPKRTKQHPYQNILRYQDNSSYSKSFLKYDSYLSVCSTVSSIVIGFASLWYWTPDRIRAALETGSHPRVASSVCAATTASWLSLHARPL